jgi:hypothetical protein
MSLSEVYVIKKYDINEKFQTNQFIGILLLSILCPLFFPTLLSYFGIKSTIISQLVVGGIVNSVLIYAALNVTKIKNIVALIILPSIVTLSAGMIFGTSNKNIIYMTFFIWLGNMALITFMKSLHLIKKIRFELSLVISAIVKAVIIYLGLIMFLNFNVITGAQKFIENFSFSMGIMQFITCITGGILLVPLMHVYSKIFAIYN